MEEVLISWSGYEYEHKERSRDWFIALGIIAASGATAAIIYKNYIFAIFIIVAAVALGIVSAKRPEEFVVDIGTEGIRINNYFYPYKTIQNFWIIDREDPPKLLFHSDKIILPIISIPIFETDPNALRSTLQRFIKEEELADSVSHKIMDRLGL